MLFLGTGSAFTVNDFHSNILLISENSNLLIDCGSDARFSLYEQGFSFDDIHEVYITHLHADHVGGLEWLGFCRKFDSNKDPPILNINKQMATTLWNHTLSGGMASLQGVENTLEKYYKVNAIGKENKFVWNNIVFKLVQTIHTYNNRTLNPSYGLFFVCNDIKTFITSDTQFTPEKLMTYYHKSDLIFHDCEITTRRCGVHTHYEDLKSLPSEIRSKMWLYHYNPIELPDAVADGFKGFVKKGQTFLF